MLTFIWGACNCRATHDLWIPLKWCLQMAMWPGAVNQSMDAPPNGSPSPILLNAPVATSKKLSQTAGTQWKGWILCWQCLWGWRSSLGPVTLVEFFDKFGAIWWEKKASRGRLANQTVQTQSIFPKNARYSYCDFKVVVYNVCKCSSFLVIC